MSTNVRHWKPLGLVGAAVSNLFPLDSVRLGCEHEADIVELSTHGVGRCRSVVGLLSNEELDVLDNEGVMGGVGTALAVFAWPEEVK